MREEGTEHVFLDASMIADFATRFPTIWRACRSVGLDPTIEYLPVAPAAHYLSGGVVTDLDGATTMPHLWSCGEAACSGVHGANRLASNSLLDGLVYGTRVVEAIAAGRDAACSTGAMTGVLDIAAGAAQPDMDTTSLDAASDPEKVRGAIQHTMSADSGVVRDAEGLESARAALRDLGPAADELRPGVVPTFEVRNLLRVARGIVAAATTREESRGSHTRADFPLRSPEFYGRLVLRGAGAPVFVPIATEPSEGVA
jgi:L-aspartate oxidase